MARRGAGGEICSGVFAVWSGTCSFFRAALRRARKWADVKVHRVVVCFIFAPWEKAFGVTVCSGVRVRPAVAELGFEHKWPQQVILQKRSVDSVGLRAR